MKKVLIILLLLTCFGQISSSELVAKLSEYKKEIGIATAVASGVVLYKVYQNKVYQKFCECNELKDELEIEKLRSSTAVEMFKELTQKNNQLNQRILEFQNQNNNLHIDNHQLNLARTKLIKDKKILNVKKAILIKKAAELSRNNGFVQVQYANSMQRLIHENNLLNAQLRELQEHQEASPDSQAELQEMQVYLVQEWPSHMQHAASALPAHAITQRNLNNPESKENHEDENLQRTISGDCGDSFEEVNVEHTIRQIQEFIESVISLKKNSGNNLDWHHYLLDNYKVIQCKIVTIKNDLQGKIDPESELQLQKILKFMEEITILEDGSPWKNGQLVMSRLKERKNDYIEEMAKDPSRHLKAIVDLVWYFYSLAAKKGQDFEQGTFGINYEKELICTFLCKYKEAYSRTNYEACGIKAPILMTSHYYEHKDKMEQFGIDIPREERVSLILPKGMTHILFGLIPGGNLFLKPEDYGIGNIRDLVDHSVDYALSKARKMDGIGHGDEQKGMRKERVPKNILVQWKELFNVCFGSSDSILVKNEFNVGKTNGIAKMLDIVDNSEIFNIENQSCDQKRAKSEFRLYLKSLYDNLYSRTGNEVILAQQDFGF